MSLNLNDLRIKNIARGVEWWGDSDPTHDDIQFRAIELGGEAGEALDAVKKLVRFRRGIAGGTNEDDSRNNIADELADVIICADRLAESLNINLGEAVKNKFNKTSKKMELKTRFGDE